MKILNFREAMQVYEIIEKYFPDGLSDNPVKDVLKIIPNLEDYLKCLMILIGKDANEILKLGGERSVGLFIESYKINQMSRMFTIMEKMLNGSQ